MQVRHREVFTSIKTEGAILPPDLLQRISSGDGGLDGLRPQDYHLAEGEKLNEAINRSWNVLQGHWRSFQNGREKLPDSDLGTTLSRERWLLPLFQGLGYGRLLTQKAIDIENKTYPISHSWNKTPIHLVGCNVDLDHRMAGVAGAARSSPHSLTQELLNRSDDHLWAFLSNGLRLRILRDNLSLTRQAYVEFDLETMMEGEIYSDFVLLWLLCHQSRVETDKPEEFWLERWSRTAQEQGTRALDQLRDGVEDAIKALGSGFLKHPLNWGLREKLKAGKLDKQDYYRQILRLIYRLLFLFVAEDRDMLFDPGSSPEGRNLYTEHYSTIRLRRIAEKFRGTRHSDLYQGFRLISEKLGEHGCPELGLPALGSFLFTKNKALPDLENSEISNEDFLNAIRALAFTLDQGTLRAVDYKNLGSEEFGSVYESLLELHPSLNAEVGTFELELASGHERKTTGSYYTHSSLVQCLLDSALNPILDEAAKKPDPEKVILDLKICDPATGSGHFLIAAAHRVARRLAAIRTGDEEPAPEAIQAALRDVISHCIYGVDLNHMAVELCKVALWMEALEPGKPLSFLDHKIQCGNSLLGTTPKMVAEGIPTKAFKPIEGDDETYCSVLRKRNEQERQGQMTMWATMVEESHATYGSLSDRYRTLDKMDDSSTKAIAEKEKQYDRLLQSSNYQHSRLIADAWCAAFVWPKRTDAPEPITQDIFRKIQSLNLQPLRETVAEVHEVSEKYNFFHWHLAFPDVFHVPPNAERAENDETGLNGGFDVIIGNPPWDQIQFDPQEFLSGKTQEIISIASRTERERLIKEMKIEDPGTYDSLLKRKRSVDGVKHFVHNSSLYPLTSYGRLNLYSLFAELVLNLISPYGFFGIILPSGIATDSFNQLFFNQLIESNTLVSLFDFENRERKLFPGVYYRMRFCLLTVCGKEHKVTHPDFVFFALDSSDLQNENMHFHLSQDEFVLLNPNTKTCPIFRSKRDAEITKEIYHNVPSFVIDKLGEEGDPWGFSSFLMFMMNTDSNKFRTRERLESQNGELVGNSFIINGDEKYLPLYEGRMIDAFDHRFASTFEKQIKQKRSGESKTVLDYEKEDSRFFVMPRYWIKEEEVIRSNKDIHERGWTLGCMSITSATNARTSIMAVIPQAGIGNSITVIKNDQSPILQACLLANFSSFVFDYVCKQKVSGNNFNQFIIKQLPVINPSIYSKECPWSVESKIQSWLLPRILELIYTASDLENFAKDCGYMGLPFRWDTKRRFLLKCELDAAFFHLYKITFKDLSYIMDAFTIVRKKEEDGLKVYKTKNTIQEIYKKMAAAMNTGVSYGCLLDPPPADPAVTHLAEDKSRQPGSIWHLSDLAHSTPSEHTINVQIPKEYLAEGIDPSGKAKFRLLKEDERITRECQVVIVRHPELQRGAEKVSIAAGKFYWAEQRDVETGKPFILITLRTKGMPVKLKLSLEEWEQFQPMAVLED